MTIKLTQKQMKMLYWTTLDLYNKKIIIKNEIKNQKNETLIKKLNKEIEELKILKHQLWRKIYIGVRHENKIQQKRNQ